MVTANKEILQGLRTNFDKPDTMKELCRKLQRMFSFLVVYCFNGSLHDNNDECLFFILFNLCRC